MQFDVDRKIGDTEECLHVRPLTHCNRQGEVYQRSVSVESQIKSALALSPNPLIERALLPDYQCSDYLQEECLVYLIREYKRKGQDSIVNDLSPILIRRCAKSKSIGRLQKLGHNVAKDAFCDVIHEVFTQILELGNDRGDFLQVRFWVVLERLVISTFGRYIKSLEEAENTVPLSSLTGYESDTDDSNNRTSVPVGNVATSPLALEQRILYQEGLNTLKEPYRTAFVLRYYCDWPIKAHNPSIPTISRHFNVTSRTIQTWLTKAEETLEHWRGENHETA